MRKIIIETSFTHISIKTVGRDGRPVPYNTIPVCAGNEIFAQTNNRSLFCSHIDKDDWSGGICRIAEQARQASPRREGYANAQAFAGVAEKRVGWHFRKKMTEGAHFARFSPSTAKAVPLLLREKAI